MTNIEGVPDGYELVRIGRPKEGEFFIDCGKVARALCNYSTETYPIVRGPYESEGHKDRCALIGLLVSRTLDMRDASPKEIEKRVDAMGMGLRIIATWAACDSGSGQSRMDAMHDIHKRAMQSLGRDVESA